jgi:hypothetical protein
MSKIKHLFENIRVDAYKLRNRQKIADLAEIHVNTVSNFINNKQTPGFTTLLAIEAAIQEIKRTRINEDE